MTKADKIAFMKDMLLVEREESAVTGSRLSIFPFSATAAGIQATERSFAAKGKTGKKKKAIQH